MKGLGVSPGIGIGKAVVIDKASINITKNYIKDAGNELDRLMNAIEACLLYTSRCV